MPENYMPMEQNKEAWKPFAPFWKRVIPKGFPILANETPHLLSHMSNLKVTVSPKFPYNESYPSSISSWPWNPTFIVIWFCFTVTSVRAEDTLSPFGWMQWPKGRWMKLSALAPFIFSVVQSNMTILEYILEHILEPEHQTMSG